MRTSSPPACRIASACSTVASMSCVRVAHILWTAMGWAPPMKALPTRTARVGFLLAVIMSILWETRDGAKADRLTTDRPRAKPLYCCFPFALRRALYGTPSHRPRGRAGHPVPLLPNALQRLQGGGDHSYPAGADGREHARDRLLVRVDERVGGAELPDAVADGRAHEGDPHPQRVLDRLLVEVEGPRVEVRVLDGVEQVEVLAQLAVEAL